MLLQSCVWAFFIWEYAWVVLLLLAPACPYLPKKCVWVHLGCVTCHLAVLLAVSATTYIPPGNLEGYTLYAPLFRYFSEYALIGFDLFLLSHCLNFSGIKKVVAIFAASIVCYFSAAYVTSYFVDRVSAFIADQASTEAGTRPYCVALNHHNFRMDDGLSLDALMRSAFDRGVEYHWFYALLIIGMGERVEVRNWSFRSLGFVPVTAYYEGVRECEPKFATK